MKRGNGKKPMITQSRTFHLQSCPSSSAITRLIEFPTSPPLRVVGEDFLHFGHTQHPLSHINRPDLFTCSGCKEYGAGKRFACRLCSEYQLHEFCALAPPSLHGHPFHVQHKLVFSAKPGGISAKSKCEACSKSIKGYAFRCNVCSFQIHPCCAMLPQEIVFSSHPHTLRLLPMGSATTDWSSLCGECGKKKLPGRVYRCTVCNYYLHAVCAKIIFNGLHDIGIKVDPENKPSKLGTAARMAAQVVTGFLGGLVEGVGEGVGEALVQNIVTTGVRSIQ